LSPGQDASRSVGAGNRANVESNLSRFRSWAKRLIGSTPAYKRTEVTIETDRVVTIRRRRSLRVWCVECGHVVDAVGAEEAGALCGMKQPMLRDRAEASGWHVCEGWDGEMLVCLDSLLKLL
jgi:hypothetical protein